MNMVDTLFPEELVLRTVILPELEQGRPDWDRSHTEAVVYWIKEICESEPVLDKKVMVTAAYAHDWGYVGLFSGRTTLDSVHTKKEEHMEVGSKKIVRLLQGKLKGEYSGEQIDRIRHLVFVHDRMAELKDEDEIAIMEADTLGQLDTDFVTPTFSKEDNRRYINQQVMKIRRPLFRHPVAIKVFAELVQKRIDFYK